MIERSCIIPINIEAILIFAGRNWNAKLCPFICMFIVQKNFCLLRRLKTVFENRTVLVGKEDKDNNGIQCAMDGPPEVSGFG